MTILRGVSLHCFPSLCLDAEQPIGIVLRGDVELTGYTDRERETNSTRLIAILQDAALRLLYREFLRETLCEENLAFYLDVMEFNKNFQAIDLAKPDAVRETLAAAYGTSVGLFQFCRRLRPLQTYVVFMRD